MQENFTSLPDPPRADGTIDEDLLREYASTGAENVFARLVDRHVHLVYSAALRQTRNHEAAQDVTQAIFIVLARKAGALRRGTVLTGWLFRAVRYAALDARKIEARRQIREQEAAHMQLTDAPSDSSDAWEQLAPLLDEALDTLCARDRCAVLLRFFERKSFGEIGATWGGNENAARVRVVRAVEKLRKFFQRRGIVVSVVTLSGALADNAVQAAPPSVASSVTLGSPAANNTGVAELVGTLLQHLRRAYLLRVGGIISLTLLLITMGAFFLRDLRTARQDRLIAASWAVRNLMAGIDRTFTLPDADGFVGLIQLEPDEAAPFSVVLTNYVTTQATFRRAMQRVFNVRQRSFDATFSALCLAPQPGLPTHLGTDSAATNIMQARYPVFFIKRDGLWKWDLFHGLNREQRQKRVETLRRKSALLRSLTSDINAGLETNVLAILETVRRAD